MDTVSKKICKKADGVSYVTQKYLQEKYPCKAIITNSKRYFTASYSSVELPDDRFGKPRRYEIKKKWIIAHVANAFTGYGKGHITLMEATKRVLEKGYDIEVWFIGDGPLKQKFVNYSQKLGINEKVKFLGKMPNGDSVRKIIRKSDIFVFPTRAEGLPRVILEAMAEGLPVISSPVCGIPEILPKECLVKYDDYNGYGNAILRLINNPLLLTKYSEDNLAMALKFKSSVLNKKRKDFYEKVKMLANGVERN